jgi:CRP/FNR family transcriptional regulator, nitrogen fixation regulation protein
MLTQTAFENSVSRFAVRTMPSIDDRAFKRPIGLMATPMSFPRNTEILGEGEPADYVYEMVSGSVRSFKMLIDGRRQIAAFYLPGDLFGLETGEEYVFSTEAVIDTKVLVMKRSAVIALAARDSEFARQLWTLTSRELQRARFHALLLFKSAPERVASFLLDMSERIQSGCQLELPMSRQDIADHLGVSIETVSRMLWQFEQASAIALPSVRRVEIRNRPALEQMIA